MGALTAKRASRFLRLGRCGLGNITEEKEEEKRRVVTYIRIARLGRCGLGIKQQKLE